MSRIDECFRSLKEQNRKGFIAYITGGDPTLDFTEQLIHILTESGVDLLEIGIPFSDPLADGTVIQEAVGRALEHHTSIDDIFEVILSIRKTNYIPIILFTYMNPVFQYGISKFAQNAKKAGVDGVLILDLPPEESSEIQPLIVGNGLDMIYIIAPTTGDDRIEKIAQLSSGFIYYVSRTGVTGEQDSIDSEIQKNVNLIRSKTTKPIAIGFGISNASQVQQVAHYGDAVVVGSAIVRHIKKYKNNIDGKVRIGSFVKKLTKPLL